MQSSTVALSMAHLLDPGPMEGVLGYCGGAGALGAQKAPPAQRLEIIGRSITSATGSLGRRRKREAGSRNSGDRLLNSRMQGPCLFYENQVLSSLSPEFLGATAAEEGVHLENP